jgi:hypothetical protein
VDSDEVQCEWRSALDEKKVVVPILYQPCEIPFRLKPIQYIDFTSRSPDDEKAIEQILNALGKTGNTLLKPIAQPRLAESQIIPHWLKGKDLLALQISISVFLSVTYIYPLLWDTRFDFVPNNLNYFLFLFFLILIDSITLSLISFIRNLSLGVLYGLCIILIYAYFTYYAYHYSIIHAWVAATVIILQMFLQLGSF